jgi:hypothetical protein
MRLVIACLILTIFVISGCEKQSDYRNKYLGNWIFEIQRVEIKDGGVIVNSDTSIHYGEIKYGDVSDEILLQFQGTNPHSPVTLRIDHGGEILPKSYSSYTSITISYTGGFEGNNILHYHYHLNHGIQTDIYETINGEKE